MYRYKHVQDEVVYTAGLCQTVGIHSCVPLLKGTEPWDSIKILVIHCRVMRMVGCLISGMVFPKAVAIGMFYWYNRKDPPVQRPSASIPQISGKKKKKGQPKGHDGFTQLDSDDMVP